MNRRTMMASTALGLSRPAHAAPSPCTAALPVIAQPDRDPAGSGKSPVPAVVHVIDLLPASVRDSHIMVATVVDVAPYVNEFLAGMEKDREVTLVFPLSCHASTIYLQPGVTIDLNGGTILPTPNAPMFIIDVMDSLSSHKRIILRNGKIIRYDNRMSSALSCRVPFPNLVLENLLVAGFDLGLDLQGCQFGTFHAVKVVDCRIGVSLRNDPQHGGANSNTFMALQATRCTVGALILQRNGNLPLHSNYFVNPSFLENSLCALAVIGLGTNQAFVYGGANEANGHGQDQSLRFDGVEIPRCSVYVSNAFLSLVDTPNMEANVTPCYCVFDGGMLSLSNPSGYGNRNGRVVLSKALGAVSMHGRNDLIGAADYLVRWPDNISGRTWCGFGVYPGRRMHHAAHGRWIGDSSCRTTVEKDEAQGEVTVAVREHRERAMSIAWEACADAAGARTLFILDLHGPQGTALWLEAPGDLPEVSSVFELPSDGWHRICRVVEAVPPCGLSFKLRADHRHRDELCLRLLPGLSTSIEPTPASAAAASTLIRGA